MSEQQHAELLARLRALNRALMAAYGPIRDLNDPQAAALLEEADAALTRLWQQVSTQQGPEGGEGR